MVEFAQGSADAESRGRPCAGGRMSEVAQLTACLVGAADIFLSLHKNDSTDIKARWA